MWIVYLLLGLVFGIYALTWFILKYKTKLPIDRVGAISASLSAVPISILGIIYFYSVDASFIFSLLFVLLPVFLYFAVPAYQRLFIKAAEENKQIRNETRKYKK